MSIIHVLFGDVSGQSETGSGHPMPDNELTLSKPVQEAYDSYLASMMSENILGGYSSNIQRKRSHDTYHYNKYNYIGLTNSST